MTLAAIDANGWTLIIAAVFLGLGQIATLVLSYLREQAKIERDAKMAAEIKDVRTEVKEVHGLTNSMQEKLGLKTEAEGLARGKIEERDRADAAAKVEADAKARGAVEERARADEKREVKIEQRIEQASVDKQAEAAIKKDIAKVPAKVVEKIAEREEEKKP